MASIPVNSKQGVIGFCLVDDQDAHLFEDVSLCLNGPGKAAYPIFRRLTKKHYAHRVVAAEMGLNGQIDHIDTNKMNCRRSNLRQVTHGQNQSNRCRISPTTGYKGVALRKNRPNGDKKWFAQITSEGKRRTLGYFTTREEAAKCYDDEALAIFGEYAMTNAMMGLYPGQANHRTLPQEENN